MDYENEPFTNCVYVVVDPLPNIKNVGGGGSWCMNIVMARLMKEDLEVTHYGVGPLPAFTDTSRLRDLYPSFTGCSYTVVYVYAKWELSCGRVGGRKGEREGGREEGGMER